jgi:XrtJ-associated TM-motif-TM protein
MKKLSPIAFLLAVFSFAFVLTLPAHAQGFCEDSPENPTLILAGLAGGAYAVSELRSKWHRRSAAKNPKNQ